MNRKNPPLNEPVSELLHVDRKHSTVAAGFVVGMLAARLERGDRSGLDELLAASDIPPAILTSPSMRIDVDRYAALYNRLAMDGDDEAFGMFAAPLRCGSFEFLCRSVMGAPTLADALDRASRYLRLILPEIRLTADRSESLAVLRLAATPGGDFAGRRQDDPVRVFAFEWLLRLIHALSCWLARRSLPLDAVRFPYPRPAHGDDYALIYTAQSTFDEHAAALEACLDARLLDLPLRRDEAALTRFLLGAPGRIAQLYRRDREMTQRLRDLLRESLPELPSAADAALRFHLSERTLHRRLAAEGSHFRDVRDGLRRDLALSRLAKTDTPVASIAAELGFSEPSAFYRAVVGWTGRSPSAYRRAVRPTEHGPGKGSPET